MTNRTLLAPFEVISRFPRHDGTLAGILATRIEAQPDRSFLLYAGRSWSYAEFGAAVERAAALLHGRGARPGDRISVLSPSHPATVMTLFALARLGAIMVPANPNYRPEEARYVLAHAGVSGVLCAPATLATARES